MLMLRGVDNARVLCQPSVLARLQSTRAPQLHHAARTMFYHMFFTISKISQFHEKNLMKPKVDYIYEGKSGNIN